MKGKKSTVFIPIIIGAMFLVIGVLFCFEANLGVKVISYIVGIAMIMVGTAYAIVVALTFKRALTLGIFSSGALIAGGITFIVNNLASVILGLLLDLLPFYVMVMGAIILIDAFLLFFTNKQKSKDKIAWFVIELIVGIIAIALGICILVIDEIRAVAPILLGVLLAVLGIFIIVSSAVRISKKDGAVDRQKA